MTILTMGLAVFLGIHLLPAIPPARAALAGHWGEQRYKSYFALASALGLVLIVAGYAHSGIRVPVFAALPAAKAIAPLAMTVSFILLAAANMRGYLRQRLKHPMLLGVLIWSAVHLLANGDLAGTVLFGAFFAYALIDLVSAVARGAVKTFDPTARHDAIAVAAGIGVALVVMTFHRMLFGVPVVHFGI